MEITFRDLLITLLFQSRDYFFCLACLTNSPQADYPQQNWTAYIKVLRLKLDLKVEGLFPQYLRLEWFGNRPPEIRAEIKGKENSIKRTANHGLIIFWLICSRCIPWVLESEKIMFFHWFFLAPPTSNKTFRSRIRGQSTLPFHEGVQSLNSQLKSLSDSQSTGLLHGWLGGGGLQNYSVSPRD